MAAGFLTVRLLLVCVLTEVSHSSALPRARSSLRARAWQDGRGEQDVYGNPHPFQYMMALRQTDTNLHPNVLDQLQVRALRPYQPRSVPTHGPVEASPLQPRAHRNNPSAKPKSFDFSLKIPFAHGHHGASQYRPSSFYIHNSFNNPLRNHDASKPGYQFSISVPVSHRRDHHSGRPQRPEFPESHHQTQQRLHVPSDTRPSSSPWYSSQQTGHDGPVERDSAFPKRPSRLRHSPKYIDPYSGYYSPPQNPAWHGYRGHHHHGPHHGPYWEHAQHSSSQPWPDFDQSD